MGADEGGTLERLNALRDELADPKVAEHHGRVVKTTGDGLLVEYISVVHAVRCATEIQRAMADCDRDLPEDRRIRFRVGINLGDIIADRDDMFGDGVNVAARLELQAEPCFTLSFDDPCAHDLCSFEGAVVTLPSIQLALRRLAKVELAVGNTP